MPGNGNQQSDFVGAWHFLNWLPVLACPRIFHGMTRRPPREHMIRLVDDYLPYARSERQRYSWKHGLLFQVDRERRQMLAERLRGMFLTWTPPDLPMDITEAARALLDTEGDDPPPGGWGNLGDPDMPPEEFLLWPEGVPAILKGLHDIPTPEERGFPAGVPRPAPSAGMKAEPPSPVAERISGKLHFEPRPALRQVFASSVLGGILLRSFSVSHTSPGDWVILDRPEIHFGDDVIIPNLAGWRSHRAPRAVDDAYTTILPDWICEILSPNRDTSVRIAKLLAYARENVPYCWLLDPFERTLEVLTLSGEQKWLLRDAFATSLGHTRVRAKPFDAIELDLSLLWPGSALKKSTR